MKTLLKIAGMCAVFSCIALAALSYAPSGIASTLNSAQRKADGYAIGLFKGTYSNTSNPLPVLPDSLKSTDTLLVAYKGHYRMQLYYSGTLIKTYIIGLGQAPIRHKQQQGDNRTPEGDYRVIQKTIGPFEGGSAPYLGTRWMRLNYPNNLDAAAGLKKKLISKSEYDKIVAANKAGKEPLKTTKLGGGIGIHGWYGLWPGNDQQDLTWGCITMQNSEIEDLFERVGLQTRIIIYP